LKLKLKATALGKTPTFTKVDTVVCQIRDFLSIIIRLCSIMFDLRSKVNWFCFEFISYFLFSA